MSLFVVFSRMLETLAILARKLGCYKTTLNCCKEIVPFCENLKFCAEASQNFMLKTFDLSPCETGNDSNNMDPANGAC